MSEEPLMSKEEQQRRGITEPPRDINHCNGIEPFNDGESPAQALQTLNAPAQQPEYECETLLLTTCDVISGERRRDGSKWTRYTFKAGDHFMSTFDETLGAIGRANLGVECKVKYKKRNGFLNIIDIEPPLQPF